jgi:YD repeat-containing protein
MKPTYVAALALLYCTALVSCKKDDSTAGGAGNPKVTLVDACRPTQLSVLGPQNALCKFVYDSQKRLVEVKDDSKLTRFTYDQKGYLISIKEYKNDTLKEFREFSYLDGKPATEKSYFVDKGVIKHAWDIGKYEYRNQKLSKKRYYALYSTDTLERYYGYVDYTLDNNNNITSETHYYVKFNSGFPKSHSITYTYSNYPATRGINYVLNDNFDLMDNKFLPKDIVSEFVSSSSSVSFSFQRKNGKGYPTSFSSLIGNETFTIDVSYNCD